MTRIPFDPDAIRMLAAVLTETGLSEIEIRRKGQPHPRGAPRSRPAIAPMTVAAMPLAPTAVAAPTQASAEAELAAHPGAVTSPMVGVAYLLPEPGAAPFVSVGQTVAAGQTLLLIEAMKTFNQIKAPESRGPWRAYWWPTARRVEYGEVLMILEALSAPSTSVPGRSSLPIAAKSRFASVARLPELGIPTVAVHSTADADAMHVRLAEESVCIGPPPAKDSYLNMPAILSAASITGADAIHPGYGFLAENTRFVEMVEAHGLTFIGPSAAHISMMGDKIAAKAAMASLGVPLVPGSASRRGARSGDGARGSGGSLATIPGAGEGGRRWRRPRHEGGARCGVAGKMRSAWPAPPRRASAFGNDAVYLEKYLRSAAPYRVADQVARSARQTSCISGNGIAVCSAAAPETAGGSRITGHHAGCSATRWVRRQRAALRKLGYRNAGTRWSFWYQDGSFLVH